MSQDPHTRERTVITIDGVDHIKYIRRPYTPKRRGQSHVGWGWTRHQRIARGERDHRNQVSAETKWLLDEIDQLREAEARHG